MNKQEQINSDKKVLASLIGEYKRTCCLVDSIRIYIYDIDFEDNVPDQQERFLMMDQLHVYEQVQANLINRIRFYRTRVNGAEQSSQVCGDAIATHHCGQDAVVQDPNESQPADAVPESLQELVGMWVVGVYPPGWKCDGCIFSTMEDARCTKKVELVGGYYLCLADLHNSIVTE